MRDLSSLLLSLCSSLSALLSSSLSPSPLFSLLLPQAGGCTHTFDEGGYEFDTGLHYVGELLGTLLNAGCLEGGSTPESSGNGSLNAGAGTPEKGSGGGRIQWASTGRVTDEVIVGGGNKSVQMLHPKAAYIQGIKAHFPTREGPAIDAYATKLDTSRMAILIRIALKVALPHSLHAALVPLVDWLLPLTSTLDVLSSLTTDRKLIGLLGYVWGTFGLPPSRSPFAMTALIQTHYFAGSYYPVGGCSQLAARLVPTITASGGAVLVRAPVTQLLLDGGSVTGVEVKGQHVIRAKRVVSAVGLLNTLKLLPPLDAPRLRVPPSILRDGPPLRCDNAGGDDGKIEPSNAFVYLFVGLEAKDSALEDALMRHNLWLMPSWDHEADSALPPSIGSAADHPLLLFISSPSAKDPSWAQRHGRGKHVAVVLAPTRYEYWAERAEGQRIHHRGQVYDEFKAAMKERLLAKLLEQIPALAPHIAYSSLGTPLSNNFYLGTAWGEAYGLEHSARRFNQASLRPKTPIPNLYLTGQDICTDGVAGAAISAFLTASTIDWKVLVQNAGTLAAVAMTAP